MQRDFIDQKKIHITTMQHEPLRKHNTHNSLVQLAGLSMRWPSFSSLKSSSTGIPDTETHRAWRSPTVKPRTTSWKRQTHIHQITLPVQHNKHGPLVVHITLSISVLTVNTVRVYWHSTISILFRYSRLFNNKFQPLLWYHYFTIPKIWMRNALWNEAFPKIPIWSIYSSDICWR